MKLLMLDAFGCAAEGKRIDPHRAFVETELEVEGDVLVWFEKRGTDAAHAALVNGAVAHHAELDDGDPRGGLHGGVTVIPAAVAVAELVGANGRDLLDAIAFGYSAAVAHGGPLLETIERHRLHPPAMVGCFGAAAAAARLLGLDDEKTAGAISLAGALMPVAPFESFTRGATVKDLYGGYPAYVGVRAAELAASGIEGPRNVFAHDPLDPNEVDYVYLKAWPSCRSTHAALTAFEKLLPLEKPVASVHVEIYRFAAELSADADPTTPIGAKTSIPAQLEALAGRTLAVEVTASKDTGSRNARVTVRFEDGSTRTASVAKPRDETDPIAKFRRLAGDRADAIETAVRRLPDADDVRELVTSLA